MHWLLTCAVLSVSAATQVTSQKSLAPFIWPDGVSFSGVFRDHAVLQRAPQAASLYGVVADSKGTLKEGSLSVAVTMSSVASKEPLQATTNAVHVEVVNATYARWKAVLPPVEGGVKAYSFSVACTGTVTVFHASRRSLWRCLHLLWPVEHVAANALFVQPQCYV